MYHDSIYPIAEPSGVARVRELAEQTPEHSSMLENRLWPAWLAPAPRPQMLFYIMSSSACYSTSSFLEIRPADKIDLESDVLGSI